MSNLLYKSSKLMPHQQANASKGKDRSRDRRQNSLPGERRGRLVKGRQGWQREISPKENTGESCMEAKNNLAASLETREA